MKLSELNPQWDDRDWEVPPRLGVGLWFDCPTCQPGQRVRLHIWFADPIDGGSSKAPDPQHGWIRSGSSFETLSITPSVDCSRCGHWHGFITGGEIR